MITSTFLYTLYCYQVFEYFQNQDLLNSMLLLDKLIFIYFFGHILCCTLYMVFYVIAINILLKFMKVFV